MRRISLLVVIAGWVPFSAWGFQNSIKYSTSELNVSAKFPVNLAHPVEISGFDDAGRPYTITVETKKIAEKVFQVTCSLEKSGKKAFSSTISTEMGKPGSVAQSQEGASTPDFQFETLITE